MDDFGSNNDEHRHGHRHGVYVGITDKIDTATGHDIQIDASVRVFTNRIVKCLRMVREDTNHGGGFSGMYFFSINICLKPVFLFFAFLLLSCYEN